MGIAQDWMDHVELNLVDLQNAKQQTLALEGFFRNNKAEFLLGFAEAIGEANSTIAELVALKRGLELVLENGFRDVWIEGNAKGIA
ncbi:hypothetical protein ACFX15_036184 [Malus domestica]|uniref:RNase H type-1 domain-containing protein n=1 Tax=Malus domestica TaxID=3750 RepID=A0A498JW23_MALDO|nr:hypothetical protein DVH24_011611 [Malus domestica]